MLRAELACALRAVPAEKARAIVVGGRLPNGVRVVHAAVPALARLLDKGARARQQKSIEAAIARHPRRGGLKGTLASNHPTSTLAVAISSSRNTTALAVLTLPIE